MNHLFLFIPFTLAISPVFGQTNRIIRVEDSATHER